LGGHLAAHGHWEASSLMKMSPRRPSWAHWPTGRFLGLGDHMAAHWWPTHRPSLRWPAPRLPYSRLGYSGPYSKHSKQPPKQPTHTLKKHTDTFHKLPTIRQHPDEESNEHQAEHHMLATAPLACFWYGVASSNQEANAMMLLSCCLYFVVYGDPAGMLNCLATAAKPFR
jgi:hypothetical protein